MNVRLLKWWNNIQASYWFIPTLMTVAAIILSFVFTALDAQLGDEWLERIDWLYANHPDGARALLSTIAGSMITVAGVVFSITIVALAHASSQFGPRLLTNFMQDQGNQITLGTFIATFIYCLLVLRTIHSPDQDMEQVVTEPFVPQIAVLVGMALALASIGVLIYFLHHIPQSIHASNIISKIGRELDDLIQSTFPERIGKGQPLDPLEEYGASLPDDFVEKSEQIGADSSGYLQHIDVDKLMELAAKHDLIIQVVRINGEFVNKGQSLARIGGFNGDLDEKMISKIESCFVWGSQRTQDQDLLFLVNELVEIASRALSTGVNDPFTAMTCLDWLGSALINLSRRNLPGPHRYSEDHKLRLVMPRLNFNDFAEATFEPLRPYAQADRNAALRMMRILGEVALHTPNEEARQLLLQYALNLKDGCETNLTHDADIRAVQYRFAVVSEIVDNPDKAELLSRAEGSRLTPDGAIDDA